MTLPDDWLAQIKEVYPKRQGGQGWGALERLLKGHLSKGITWDQIMEGTRSYAAWVKSSGNEASEFVKQARTFYGRDLWFLEDYEIPTETFTYRRPEEVSEEQLQRDREDWANDMKERFGR